MNWDSCLDNGVPTILCVNVLIGNLINGALIFAGVTAVFFIIYAGSKFVFSHGDKKNIDSARKTITFAIIGLLIVLLAFLIVQVIIDVTGATCIGKSIGNCT